MHVIAMKLQSKREWYYHRPYLFILACKQHFSLINSKETNAQITMSYNYKEDKNRSYL